MGILSVLWLEWQNAGAPSDIRFVCNAIIRKLIYTPRYIIYHHKNHAPSK